MTNHHLAAIESGRVTKSNVIGLRKALNADARDRAGLSLSRTAPRLIGRELWETIDALRDCQPTVTGELHDSGLKLLRSPRYAKRLADVRAGIDALESFRLVDWHWIDSLHVVPVYAVWAHVPPVKGRDPFPPGVTYEAFRFYNVPWQSGGNGPELVGHAS